MRQVALIRGVNVGGRNRLPMADLCALCALLGLANPTTILQSGNVVFECEEAPTDLEVMLEKAISAELGLKVSVVVRTDQDIRGIIADNPFGEEALTDPGHLVVVFLKHVRQPETVLEWPGPERIALANQHLYVYYPEGIGTSKMPANLLEKTFGPCTVRNWNTVQKIIALPFGAAT